MANNTVHYPQYIGNPNVAPADLNLDISVANRWRFPALTSNQTINFYNAPEGVNYDNWVGTWEIIIEMGSVAYKPNTIYVNGAGTVLKYATGATPEPNKTNIITYKVLYNGSYSLYGSITAYA
jgi:hypothetical protein